MVGRLARYLRFVGCDTVYARGLTDEEILRQARTENRVIVTRDRRLAVRAKKALLLTSPHLSDQWRAVRAAYPELPTDVRFERCTECNGPLEKVEGPPPADRPEGVPWDRVAGGLPLYRCTACGHYYWEGSHTADIRARLALWARESAV
jgi:hypothetical protein